MKIDGSIIGISLGIIIQIGIIIAIVYKWRKEKKEGFQSPSKKIQERPEAIDSVDQSVRPKGTWVTPDNEEISKLRIKIESLEGQMSSIEESRGDGGQEIEWLKLLKKQLKESVSKFSEDLVDEENWRELKERVAYLGRFRSALEEIKSAMSQDDRTSFAVYVDREVEKPLKQIRDLLTLREMQNDLDDPVLLLKGALTGDEVFNASSIASLLRRTRPAQMIRYFLPEIDTRVTQNGQADGERVFELMMDLSGDEVEIIGARSGDSFDMSRYQIVSQDTSGTQSRDRIVKCLAHGLKNSQTDEIELKAKVVIAV